MAEVPSIIDPGIFHNGDDAIYDAEPYYKVSIDGKIRTSSVKTETKFPSWDEKFKL
jgi:hypothetical protein